MLSENIENINMPDGESIKTVRFNPENQPVGVIQMLHGFGEHSSLYSELAGRFTEHNFACVIHDQRGHGEMPGLSEKQREKKLGVAKNYEYFLKDIDVIRDKIGEWYPDLPVFLYGHSMGGNIAINYLLTHSQDTYKKVILETPWLRLYEKQNPVVLFIARIIGGLFYKAVYHTKLNIDSISRDKEFTEKLKEDTQKKERLYHDSLSFRLITQIFDAGEYAIKNADQIKLPVLLLCAGKDTIVSPDAIRKFYENSDKNVVQFEEYPESYHALHNDLNRAEVFNRMLAFITNGK